MKNISRISASCPVSGLEPCSFSVTPPAVAAIFIRSLFPKWKILAALVLSCMGCNYFMLPDYVAEHVIQDKISEHYGLRVPKALEIERYQQQLEGAVLEARLALALGVVEAIRTRNGRRGTAPLIELGNLQGGDRFEFTTTAKGSALPHWEDSDSYWFATSQHEVEAITGVSETSVQTFTVGFSYIEHYTPFGLEVLAAAEKLGQPWTPDHSIFLGQFTIRYDPSLEDFMLVSRRRKAGGQWVASTWVERDQAGQISLHGPGRIKPNAAPP